jgi:molybdopterin/thiamine biosynthesis adenylyltransferase
MEHSNFKIIGIGAGGSNLVHYLGQYLNFHGDGSVVTLIDGDSFESKNFQNQRFRTLGFKADIKKDELREEFRNVRFRSVPEYVSEDNIDELIEDDDIVFLGVDNYKTMNIVNAHCRTLDNVVLISGGVDENIETQGDVCIYIRQDGVDITPDMTYKHNEIAEPVDNAPYEANCDDVIQTKPARLFSVLAVVEWMMTTFANLIEGRIDYYEIYFDTGTCSVRKVMIPEDFNA